MRGVRRPRDDGGGWSPLPTDKTGETEKNNSIKTSLIVLKSILNNRVLFLDIFDLKWCTVLQVTLTLGVIRKGGMIRRLNFMISKFNFFMRSNYFWSWDQIIFDHEIKFFIIFYEVEIPNNDLISWSQHFSLHQNCLVMLFRILISWSFLQLTNWSWGQNSK